MDVILKVDHERADQVLRDIDAILKWKIDLEEVVEKKLMILANNLLEAYQNAYWIRRGFEDESQYIEASFPRSRSLYYDLIRIAKTLNHYDHRLLGTIGVSGCRELCKIQKAFGTIPTNYFLYAQEEDRETFKARVRSAVQGVHEHNLVKGPKEETTFVTLAFIGDQIYDWNEGIRIAMMESGTEKTTEAACVLAKDFLSGYRDDGKGRVYNRNAFLLGIISRLYRQIDREQAGIYDRMIAHLATWVEEGRDEPRT